MKTTGKHQVYRLLTMFVALAGLFLIWKSNSTDSMEGVPSQLPPKVEKARLKNKLNKPQPVTPASATAPVAQRQPQEAQDEMPRFSYSTEVAQVNSLVAQFPASRLRLIEFINRPDFFKAEGREVKPHTLSEQMQMKMGAVKVMALRELMKSEKDLSQLSVDLQKVAQSAQDPTIRSIAQAAEDSLSKGRSFFDDFLDGIERMPLTN